MGLRRSHNIRGIRDIRTYSGRVDVAGVPYLAYMKISCLEMEKARRGKERNSVISRIRNINSRIRDIDAERDMILKDLGKHQETNADHPATNDGTRQRNSIMNGISNFPSSTGGNKDKDGFKIRY
jgi:hypothetical protein